MPRTSKQEAPIVVDEPVIEARYVDLGGTTVGYEHHKADMDPGFLFQGLPGDRCPCHHWGTVVSGKVVFRYADHDEEFVAGDSYVAGPGHLPLMFGGTELIEFTPTAELHQTMAVIGKNLEATKALQ